MYRKRPEAPKQPLGRIFDGDTAEVRGPGRRQVSAALLRRHGPGTLD